MFGEFVEARSGEAGRKSWAIVISTMGQAAVLLLLILAPMLYTEALPVMLQGMRALLAPPAVPLVDAPKPPPSARAIRRAERFIRDGVLHAPSYIPPSPLMVREPELPPDLPEDARGAGFNGADLFGYLTTSRNEAEPPPVTPAPISRIQRSHIEPAMILSQPQPVYPPLARSVRIQGDVVLRAIIDKEGGVAELQVVSGHPILAQAALAAVRAWRYRPTLLNGEPVEVETTITVTFLLGR
jgi:protein TonB